MSSTSVVRLLALALAAGGCACGGIGLPRVLYVARHGQTEYNRLGRFQGDPDLDPVGYVNRVSLWMLLRDRPIDSIYTSEAQRTQRTAELVALQHRLKVQPHAALNEINSGIMTGVCYAQLNPETSGPADQRCLVPARGSRPEETLRVLRRDLADARKLRVTDRLPLGESYADVAKRVAVFVEELRGGAREREVLVVGHGVVNQVLLHLLVGWTLQEVSLLHQQNDQVYRLRLDEQGRVQKIDLYTPGFGWRSCAAPPRLQRDLDCNPGPSLPTSQPAH